MVYEATTEAAANRRTSMVIVGSEKTISSASSPNAGDGAMKHPKLLREHARVLGEPATMTTVIYDSVLPRRAAPTARL